MRSLWKSDSIGNSVLLPQCLQVLVNIIIQWHGEGTKLILKEIRSTNKSTQQDRHRDYVYDDIVPRKIRRIERLFSAILALEIDSNPTRIVNHEGNEISIPQGSMLVWRGEYYHAGASYSKKNRRLFFHVLGPNVDESIIDEVEL